MSRRDAKDPRLRADRHVRVTDVSRFRSYAHIGGSGPKAPGGSHRAEPGAPGKGVRRPGGLAGVSEPGGDPGDRPEQRPAHRLALRRRSQTGRGGAARARPGSRSSGRRRGCGGGSTAAVPAGGRAALSPRRSPSLPRPCARARPRSSARRRSGSSSAGHELEVAACDLEARLRQRHLQVLDQRAEERERAIEPPQLAQPVARARERLERRAAAVPRGQQAPVLRPREHPWDRPQPRQVVLGAGPPAGREPISNSASSSTGVNARKNSTKRGSSQTSARYAACAAAASVVSISRVPSGGADCDTAGNAETIVAASAASRLR